MKKHLAARTWTQAEFAQRVQMSPAGLNAILKGKRKPWFGRSIAWADALSLTGSEREDYLDAMAIAASPSRIAALVTRLERKRR